MAITTERGKVAHLLRRTGFGASIDEIDAGERAGLQATIDRLVTADRAESDIEARVPRAAFDFTRGPEAVRWWVLRMAETRTPFVEKLTLFWHGLLTSGLSKTGGRANYMVQQIDTYRRMAYGSFRELVVASAKDPAMILWLDNNQNRRGRPNENYARELMELFMLGIGNYSEQDIREAARAFTGWFQRDGEYFFAAQQHDTGSKTVLGMTGNWNGEDVIDILVRQPACHRFIATKLWSFFAYPDPEPEVVGEIADVFRSSAYDIRATLKAMFTHPAFYSERAYHALVKSPLEYTIGFIRTLGGKTDGQALNGALQIMGQVPLNPPNVQGWPGGPEWVSTTALITRYNFANNVLRAGADGPTAVDIAALLRGRTITTRDQVLDFFVDLMLDGDLPAAKRQVLADYLVQDDNGRPTATFRLDDRTINNKVRGLIYLLATTPEYQLN